jgi:adenine-specific DNA methylase
MNNVTDKRLIEDYIPIKKISEEAIREKAIRQGHISTLHLWWARRPLVASRAAVFGALAPEGRTPEEKSRLNELMIRLCKYEVEKRALEESRELLREAYSDSPPKVLDMFAGGGSFALEGLRLGCETYAVDLNPVAHIIELATLVYPQQYGSKLVEDVRKWGKWILEEARSEIGHFYEDSNGQAIVAYLWARTVRCPNPACGAEIPLVNQWWLAKGSRRKVAIRPVLVPMQKTVEFEIVENDQITFNPSEGTIRRGRAYCPSCGEVTEVDYLKHEGQSGRLSSRLMAVAYTTPGQTGKRYRIATSADNEIFSHTERMLASYRREKPEILPTESIGKDAHQNILVTQYGLKHWDDLFTARQALALATLTEKTRDVYGRIVDQVGDQQYAKAVTTYLGVIIDKLAERTNSLSIWGVSRESVNGIFIYPSISMVWNYAELNPFSATQGWTSILEQVCSAIKSAILAGNQPATVNQGDATQLPYSDDLFDLVVVDPPYYNSVPYADLSDFYYVWLKRSVGRLYPEVFAYTLSSKKQELNEKLQFRAFSEAKRVVSKTGIVLVFVPYSTSSPLEVLVNNLSRAGLSPIATWPLFTETFIRLRADIEPPLPSTMVFACRRRSTDLQRGDYHRVRALIRARVRDSLSLYRERGVSTEDLFFCAIGPAVNIWTSYKSILTSDGLELSAKEVLNIVDKEVVDFILLRSEGDSSHD